MRLQVLVPTEILVDREVVKVIAEAEDGAFCLLPRHVDFVAALPPGLLAFETPEGREVFLGVDEGILVKVGDTVRVSTRSAVEGPDLGALRERIAKASQTMDERERAARGAAARLEADLVRRLMEMTPHG